MVEIYFYKETELKYSVYANSIEDVIEAPADYYAEYTTDMVITDVKFLNPIYINGELREMTREEKVVAGIEVVLEEGEIIKRKKIIKIEKPSQWHTWAGTEWVVDLEEVKARKREELKAVRTAKIQADIEVHGEVFQVRDSDKENFDDTGLMIRTGEIDYSYVKNWILADNSVKPFTAQQIIDVWKERTKRKDKIFLEFGQLSMQLEACQTVEEIEAIKWE
ncbi:DUF4376 domain-containing protein [Fusobacterium gastrosuis]|uniref:DUF4376 domain-containing protein n=1 Tax=Fusobacterium gastrosuis TaxID=1755100 RepID=UPI0029749B24|nr:DUF4376 domain-containing protein [Fusobacteriaceae bacterium]MDY5712375.1 DUF4376 domain-containing protein [Fusobacterium gastrosuis]